MNPGAAVLLILGYGLILPIGAKITQLSRSRLRFATVGIQFGLILAASGWLLRSSPLMAALHIIGAIAARLYLRWRVERQAPTAT